MRTTLLLAALCALTLFTLPAVADANCGCHNKCGYSKCGATKCGSKCGSYHAYGKCGARTMAYGDSQTAVAGYNDEMRDDYLEMRNGKMSAGYMPGGNMRDIDQARIAEYHRIFGSSPRMAGYTTTWSPWNEGGTWVTVNGNRVWATEDDFVWSDGHWTWADDNDAMVTFDDDRFNIDAQDWGVNDITVDHDRFDLDVDREKLDLDTDTFKVPDKLEIK